MKKLLLLFFLCASSLVFSANVYFDNPVNNAHYQLSSSGSVGVNYHIHTVSNYFLTDWYGAKIQYPNGTWSAWQNGQSGGWVFTTPGTYHIQGAVHVDVDFGGEEDYFMYSNVLTFYVDSYTPPPSLSASIYGPTTINWGVNATWNASPLGGYPPYHYQWWYKYPGNEEERPVNITADIDPGEINPDLPAPGYWNQIAIDSPTLTRHDYLDHYLKCVVKDAHNTSVTSNILFISVIGGNSPLQLPKDSDKLNIENKELTLGSYPNPFNPSTQINVIIPTAGMVSLKIYDILGREVAVLANEFMEIGEYEFNFIANNLPSGTYISALTTNNGTITQKLLLIK